MRRGKEAVRCGRRIQQWVIGLDELDEDGVANLKKLLGVYANSAAT